MRRRMRAIAVLFDDPGATTLRERETLRGIWRYARESGRWHVSLDPYADRADRRVYDGLIATTRKGRGPGLARYPSPVVHIAWGLVHHDLVRVRENRYASGRLAAWHLVEQGCRTFGYVGFSKQRQSAIERKEFSHQLRRLGRRARRARMFMTYASSRRWWERVMRSLGQWVGRLEPPAGVLVARPGLARAVADLALRQGIRIPQDLAIVAADDDPVVCALHPALTAVHFDYAEQGYQAAALLDRLIDGERPPDRAVLIDPTLVGRRSTDRKTLGDPVVARALLYIEQHCTERFDWRTLDTGESDRMGPRHVAEAVGLSQSALGERMRAARGRTIAQEIARARVAFARYQLEHSEWKMPVIVHESCFGSYAAMLRAFRRHLGAAPSALRREARRRGRGSRDAEQRRRRR